MLIVLILLLAAVLAIRWQAVLSYLGDFLVLNEAPQSADLILVLAGDFYGPRVFKAADLAMQGYAPVVLISGAPYQGRPEGEFTIPFLAKRGYPPRLFESFGHNAQSTIEEAIALRPELTRRGVKRILLVTSAYHSRRAAIVFRLFCPGIQYISVSAPDHHYHSNHWWDDPSSRKYFFREWPKILGTVLFAYPKYLVEKIVGH